MAESEWLSRSVCPTEAPLCQRLLSFELATLVRCPKSTFGLDQSSGRSTPHLRRGRVFPFSEGAIMEKLRVAGALTIQVEFRVKMGTAQTRKTMLRAQSPSRASG